MRVHEERSVYVCAICDLVLLKLSIAYFTAHIQAIFFVRLSRQLNKSLMRRVCIGMKNVEESERESNFDTKDDNKKKPAFALQ